MSQVTEFRTASVSVDHDARRVHVSADDYRTSAREWKQVLRYLATLGSVTLSEPSYPDTSTLFVMVGTF